MEKKRKGKNNRSLHMHLWSSQDATYSGSSSPSQSASDELVADNVQVKYLVFDNSHILQAQALYIFHFDERITYELNLQPVPFIYEMKNYMRYLKLLNKFRCVMIRVDSFVAVTLHNDLYIHIDDCCIEMHGSYKMYAILNYELESCL